MVIAGETSGDILAAELVAALREIVPLAEGQFTSETHPLSGTFAPEFFGAGGPAMARAGVRLEHDLTQHAVVGPADALRHYFYFRRIFQQLLAAAFRRQPDAIILVDFSGFNLRFARALRRRLARQCRTFNNWNPKLIYYVSPQVWASRPHRARVLAENIDLLLSIFPFEKDWYAQRAPNLRVEFVGHPLLDRYQSPHRPKRSDDRPVVVLLPGSRVGELNRHMPVLQEAVRLIQAQTPARFILVLPNETLARRLEQQLPGNPPWELQIGSVAEALSAADVAIASTGTVTLECAYFRVPAIAIYKTSWTTYQIGKRLIQVRWLAMPNIIANETIYPEFVQENATAVNIANKALDLLTNPPARQAIQAKLNQVIESLGKPGAARRGAEAIARLIRGY